MIINQNTLKTLKVMSRKIKFRLWVENTMYYPDNNWRLILEFNKISGWNLVPNYKPNDGKYIAGDSAQNPFIMMQYTGRNDKNGKEIYEGDLINSFQNDYQPTEVLWCDNSGQYMTLNYHSTLPLWDSIDSKIEVLGNIYENPELSK